jgi:pyrroloquinoline quinone biosynthesis protein B
LNISHNSRFATVHFSLIASTTFLSLVFLISSGTVLASAPLTQADSLPYLIILGTVQDGGAPHIGCQKSCCADLWDKPDQDKKVVSIGLVDPISQNRYLFDATPEMPKQINLLMRSGDFEATGVPDGIFLTHAHVGHYAGLMYLGKEALAAHQVPVFAMPRMCTFLTENGPWSQLVSQQNISLRPIADQGMLQLTGEVRVTPFTVPHRDEFSETVGFLIEGPEKRALFIPDIDKWEKWETSVIDLISSVDHAFIDGTFYDSAEINHRDISEIPHPFIIESMTLFDKLPADERQKIYFIHLNHTNRGLDPGSDETQEILRRGYHVARMGEIIGL